MRPKLRIILMLILHNACLVVSLCKDDQACVTAQLCKESDDSGKDKLGPRLLYQSCGIQLVCCDKAQLESYHATMESDRLAGQVEQLKAVITQTTEPPSNVELENGYKSCGLLKECVPRHLCRTGTLNKDGRFLIRPRIDEIHESDCSSFESCCPTGDQLSESENPVRRHLKDFRYHGCGYSNPDGLYYKMVGYNDSEAQFAEFPWIVAVMDMEANYVCGGTLIHPLVVLTSAHNVANHSSDSLLARAGEHDMSSQREPLAYQTRRIRNLWRHEHYNKLNLRNDIAMIVLEQPFQLAPNVQPLCLPPVENEMVQQELREAKCFAIGWGQRNVSNNFMEHILKSIDLPLVEHQHCQRLLRRTILGRRFLLHNSFVCAGGVEGKDTCKGDGGSPLFCSIAGQNNRYHLAGIVSWGIECSAKNIPAAYTNVPYLRSWIDEQLDRIDITLEEQ